MAHLLIVDDDPLIRRALIRSLRPEHTCVAAANGLEALRYLNRIDFDLVISDIDMPVMNGIDFYRNALKVRPGIKVVFRTGSQVPNLAEIGVPIFPKNCPISTILRRVSLYPGVTLGDASGQSEAISQVGRG